MKRLENARQFVFGNPDPTVADAQLGLALYLSQPDRDSTLKGEFESVGEKVEHDLLPHVAIDIGGSANRGQSMTRAKPARSHAEWKLLASSPVNVAKSVASYVAWARPASIREKSSSELTSFSRRKELR
jgi:hypothetical protein